MKKKLRLTFSIKNGKEHLHHQHLQQQQDTDLIVNFQPLQSCNVIKTMWMWASFLKLYVTLYYY